MIVYQKWPHLSAQPLNELFTMIPNCLFVLYYAIVARYSVAVITGIFDAAKSFPLRVMMTSALALRADLHLFVVCHSKQAHSIVTEWFTTPQYVHNDICV